MSIHNFTHIELIDESGQTLAKCASGNDLIKAHIRGYTRKDGTFVAEHNDKRQVSVHNATTEKTMSANEKYSVVESRNGKFWTFKDGSKKWYARYHEGETSPHPRALWCATQREARENDGAANVAFGV